MALIKCADCGRSVSRSANACPNCGRPTGRWDKGVVTIQKTSKDIKLGIVGGLALAITGILIFFNTDPSRESLGTLALATLLLGVGTVIYLVSLVAQWWRHD